MSELGGHPGDSMMVNKWVSVRHTHTGAPRHSAGEIEALSMGVSQRLGAVGLGASGEFLQGTFGAAVCLALFILPWAP